MNVIGEAEGNEALTAALHQDEGQRP